MLGNIREMVWDLERDRDGIQRLALHFETWCQTFGFCIDDWLKFKQLMIITIVCGGSVEPIQYNS